MDNFLDVIIVRKKKGLYSLLYFFASLSMIVFALIASMSLFQVVTEAGINYMFAIIFVVTGGFAFLLYWSRGLIKIDYDISFTNGLVEIARVANNIRRKEICKFYMRDVEVGAYTTSPNYNRYTSMKDMKKLKAWLNKDEKKFFVVVRINEEATLLTMEANEEIIKLMHHYNPRNVKIK